METKNIGVVLAGLVNLGSICGLAYIGLKRNRDCYKAECELIEAEYNKALTEIDNAIKDTEIKQLKSELEEMKKLNGSMTNEEEA